MPTQRFFDLDREKRERILEVSLKEFARYGYENSSTNRIISQSDISKGSLFKYFDSKEELYMYLLEICTCGMMADLSSQAAGLSGDLFEMAVEYSTMEFGWYAAHPDKARLIIDAFRKSDTEISQKIREKYSGQDDDVYYRLVAGVDDSGFRYGREKTVNIFKWFMKGFNGDFLESLQYGENIDMEALKDEYISALREHTEVLRRALMN